MAARHVLVVDDDPTSRDLLRHVLERAGHEVLEAGDGDEASCLIEQVHLLVLDLVMPNRDGWSLLQAVRSARPGLPVVIVSGLEETADDVRGLELGADDYLVKPVHPSLLAARIGAALRRSGAAARSQYGALTIGRARREVVQDGHIVHLTPRECDVLAYLAACRERVVSREELHAAVWIGGLDADSRAVDVCVASIRRRLDDRGYGARFVATSRGRGYRFVAGRAEAGGSADDDPVTVPGDARSSTRRASVLTNPSEDPRLCHLPRVRRAWGSRRSSTRRARRTCQPVHPPRCGPKGARRRSRRRVPARAQQPAW